MTCRPRRRLAVAVSISFAFVAGGCEGGPAAPHGVEAGISDARDADSSRPLPASVAPPKRIVAGSAQLVGGGVTACTNQVPPSGNGDRWCAFKRRVPETKNTELWVINVTKATASDTPTCDGTSPDCLRLTSNAWIDEPYNGPYPSQAHRFDGDTLLFHADALSMGDVPYTGPVWAWRPGWSEARQLSAKAYNCWATDPVPVAFCVDDIAYNGAEPLELDLRAGAIAQPPVDILPKIDHVFMHRADGEVAYRAGFTRGGQSFVYSAPVNPESTAAPLRVARLENGAFVAPQVVMPDVMVWDLSIDGTTIFHLTDVQHTTHTGRLAMADFPSGANPRLLPPYKIRGFSVLGDESVGDRGVGFFTEPHDRFLGEYHIVADRSAPDTVALVFRYPDPLEGFDPSTDHRYTAYAKDDPNEGFNGYIALNDGTGECMMNTERNTPALEFAFLDHSGLVFWGEPSRDQSSKRDGWFGDPDGCRDRHRFAEHIGFFETVHDEALIYGDELDDEDTVTLKYAALDHGNEWPADGPVRIHPRVDFPIAILGPQMRTVVFQVTKGSAETVGLYVVGPLPLGP